MFIHDALLESIMCGDNSIKAPELKKKVEELKEIVPETGVSMFESQFNVSLDVCVPMTFYMTPKPTCTPPSVAWLINTV